MGCLVLSLDGLKGIRTTGGGRRSDGCHDEDFKLFFGVGRSGIFGDFVLGVRDGEKGLFSMIFKTL